MILVVGGKSAGKREFVKKHYGYTDADIAPAAIDERPVVCSAQDLAGKQDANLLCKKLLEKKVVICDEVGSGVVPLDPQQRQWREAAGRLCCALAEQAEAVIRIYYGIPIPIKGSL